MLHSTFVMIMLQHVRCPFKLTAQRYHVLTSPTPNTLRFPTHIQYQLLSLYYNGDEIHTSRFLHDAQT